MTLAQWFDMGIPIAWQEYVDDTKADLEANKVELNLSAPAGLPDGVYEVRNESCSAHGVEIKDGFFVPSKRRKRYTRLRLRVI